MQQKLVQIFLQQEAGAFGNKIGKELQKPRLKLKNMYIIYLYYIYYICILYIIFIIYFLCLQSNTSGSFLQTYTYFVEKRLKFSHFDGSIIP